MPNPIPSSPTSCPTCHAIFRHPESVCSDAFHGPSSTSEGREESLPRYAIGIREFHSALGVEHDYADLSIERHAEGDWVKFADVCASLTAAQAEIERLRSCITADHRKAWSVVMANRPPAGQGMFGPLREAIDVIAPLFSAEPDGAQ